MESHNILANLAAAEIAEIAEGEWIFGEPGRIPWRRAVKCHPPAQCGAADLVIGPTQPEAPYDPMDHVGQYAAAGCAALMVDRLRPGVVPTLPVLRVPRIRRALFRLARHARKGVTGRVIAVTGSSGKTTTKEMLAFLIGRQSQVVATPGTGNSLMAICYQLINAPLDAGHYVFESGLGQAGSGIADHSGLLQPHVAIVTAVHPAHAGGYDSVDQIAHRKMDIARHLQPGGHLLFDRDSDHHELMRSLAEEHGVGHAVSFGFHAQADVRIADIVIGESGTAAQIAVDDVLLPVRLRMHGRHWAKLAAAALATCRILGLDTAQAAADLGEFLLPKGRGEVYPLPFRGGSVLVYDSHFNANPGSMAADLDAFGAIAAKGGRRNIAIVGAMRELGTLTERAHRDLAAQLAALPFAGIFLIGEETRGMAELMPSRGVRQFDTADAAFDEVSAYLAADDFLFVKGSHSNRLDQLIRRLRSLR